MVERDPKGHIEFMARAFDVRFHAMPGEPERAERQKPAEPKLEFCTQRMSEDDLGNETIDLECRFDDGQKFAAISVDGDFPALADAIANFLNEWATHRA